MGQFGKDEKVGNRGQHHDRYPNRGSADNIADDDGYQQQEGYQK